MSKRPYGPDVIDAEYFDFVPGQSAPAASMPSQAARPASYPVRPMRRTPLGAILACFAAALLISSCMGLAALGALVS